MKTTHVMSLVAATAFAIGVAGPALAQTPSTPAPTTTPAPAAQSKGDTQMDKMDKKDGNAAAKHGTKKRHASSKKTEKAAAEKTPETKAPDTKAPEQPKK